MQASTLPPFVALAMGDPCGISPELTARLLADEQVAKAARLQVIGDARILAMGAADAGLDIDLPSAEGRSAQARPTSPAAKCRWPVGALHWATSSTR